MSGTKDVIDATNLLGQTFKQIQQQKADNERRWTETLQRLSWFVTEALLYQPVLVPWLFGEDQTANDLMPKSVRMPYERCGMETNWRQGDSKHKVDSLGDAFWFCRNCNGSYVVIYFRWETRGAETCFEKVGRYPKPEINPPRELAKALGGHLDFYRRGMTLRHHGYGLGALVYFRRIVENTTDALLDLIENLIGGLDGEAERMAAIKNAKGAQRFEDKVKIAADALPAHLRMGGRNPLLILFRLLSDHIHSRTDEEAIEVVDGINSILGYLFTELKTHTEKREEYVTALDSSLERLSKSKKSRG
jgi:hypothetical protein